MIHEMYTAPMAQCMVDFSCLFPHKFLFIMRLAQGIEILYKRMSTEKQDLQNPQERLVSTLSKYGSREMLIRCHPQFKQFSRSLRLSVYLRSLHLTY